MKTGVDVERTEQKATEEAESTHLPGFVQWCEPVTALEGRTVLHRGPYGVSILIWTMKPLYAAGLMQRLLKFPFLQAFLASGMVFAMVSTAAGLRSWKAHLIFGDSQKVFMGKYGELRD